ncbi:MAG TPA: Mur ligase family protein [Patescibacteria group bacterium]|nr:Mur ligase family protein [Patescibacteria group bacterium]
MGWIDRLVVILTKFVSWVSTSLGIGAGETWPGEIAITLRPNIARTLAQNLPDGVILIAGTNGKTTTALMVKTILEHIGKSVVHNATGANLLNGVVSSFIKNADWLGRITADVGIFEIDENSLPIVLRYISPKRIVLLNLFRDQLDRYGEVDVIVEKWQKVLGDKNLVLNADDPAIASLGNKQTIYFGLKDPRKYLKEKEHASDSIFCPKCGNRLSYEGVYYSHIGVWRCDSCDNQRPKPYVSSWPSSLPGLYNQYNTLAAVAVAKSLEIPDKDIKNALKDFSPAFGRQEEVNVGSTTIKLFLSKNPAGFNASLRTVLEMGAKELLFVLNDRIPDGRDVSWIWDVDFEMIPNDISVTVSGDRVYDIALRMKYADLKARVEPDLSKALAHTRGTLFVLATYSAMLEIRKHIVGHKIL